MQLSTVNIVVTFKSFIVQDWIIYHNSEISAFTHTFSSMHICVHVHIQTHVHMDFWNSDLDYINIPGQQMQGIQGQTETC